MSLYIPCEKSLALHTPWAGFIGRPGSFPLLALPLAGESIAAGFPSPAEDYLEKTLDLNEHLAPRPEATFFVRVSGDSMIGAGIHHNDLLVVDRSITPKSGNVIIAYIDGEFTVKRLKKTEEGMELVPENPDYVPIIITADSDLQVWGVVRHVIHSV
ncbi:MAG: translesion error-prone DNA polymerase V autoproteolytic subunit [Pseudodesulfovibrio sp.]